MTGALTLPALAETWDLTLQQEHLPGELVEQRVYSPDLVYRYAMARWWGEQNVASAAIWIGLNPATGDTERRYRPTLERCVSRSRTWGATGLVFVNLFAYRANRPAALRAAADPVGPLSDEFLTALAGAGMRTVAAWGAHGRLRGRSRAVASLLSGEVTCLGTTSRGEPRHPLYVPAATRAEPWQGVRDG